MLAIVDLGIGNLQSVRSAFRRIGADPQIVTTPEAALGSSILVLPGVGAFDRAMREVHHRGFGPFFKDHADSGRPILGICLGMQLLAERSHEHGVTQGLGLIRGEVVPLRPAPPDSRVPNIGWLPVRARKEAIVFPAQLSGQSFYHVHSYHFECTDPADVAATITFGGGEVVTAVERGSVFGIQFHPEKSQEAGLDLLHSVLQSLGSKRGVVA